MFVIPVKRQSVLLLFLVYAGALLLPNAEAASCKTQSQMTPAQRDALSSTARTLLGNAQRGDVGAMRTNTIPAVAASFDGIASSVNTLKPLVQGAVFTVDHLYALDASAEPVGSPRTDFYCGTPVVVLNFTDLPPGSYALAILHATGVPQPQQVSLILSQTTENHWMLAGFFTKPMVEAAHDGVWYWTSARSYAAKNMNWNAWFYYRLATYLLNPVEFLSSSNLEKLQREMDKVRPERLPNAKPLALDAHGSAFQITTIDTTTELGPLDLEVHYTPDSAQTAQLRDPPAARKQVTELMSALLQLHPELRAAFHGIWVHADDGNASVFALELPMEQITTETQSAAVTTSMIR